MVRRGLQSIGITAYAFTGPLTAIRKSFLRLSPPRPAFPAQPTKPSPKIQLRQSQLEFRQSLAHSDRESPAGFAATSRRPRPSTRRRAPPQSVRDYGNDPLKQNWFG